MSLQCTLCLSSAKETAENKLYSCTKINCRHRNKPFCIDCGKLSHRNKKIYEHEFTANDTVPIITQQHITNGENIEEIKDSQPQSLSKSRKLEMEVSDDSIANAGCALVTTFAGPYGAILGGVVFGAKQVSALRQQYSSNDIVDENGNKDEKEYHRLVKKSLIVPAVYIIGGSIASITGIALHFVVGYSILGAIVSQTAFEKHLPESRKQRHELKMTSLRIFGFFEHDLKNKDKFNKKIIDKKYRKLAKIYHPDNKKTGDVQKFQQLEVYHRIVLSMLDDNVFPFVKFDENGSAYIDKTPSEMKKIIAPATTPIQVEENNSWLGKWWKKK